MRTGTANTPQDVVLLAFAISPSEGSESGAGWALLRAHLALGNNVVLVTTNFELQKLRSSTEFNQLSIRCLSVKDSGFILNNSSWIPFSYQLRHALWNFRLFSVVRGLARESNTLIFHYATYAGDWNINVLHFLRRNVLKIWGPVGGAQRIPLSFYSRLGLSGIIEEITKTSLTLLFRIASRKLLTDSSEIILCANSATFEFYRQKNKVVMLQNIVLNPTDFQDQAQQVEKGLVFGCGRLLVWKNWQSAIYAMRETEGKVLVIAGDGPYKRKLSKIIQKYELGDKVRLVGRLNRPETIAELARCESFIFPSLRDSASWALAEALYMKKKIIAFDLPGTRAVLGGNRELISPNSRDHVQTLTHQIMAADQATPIDSQFTVEILATGLKNAIDRLQS